ncbi:hypothetical protein [Maliponia aquimaris]|uniref:Uncharacterized protein n=1 Tax=Maliponia aquimaris TaxID=1673631 RepID=A0A238KDF0_9RHOB|nr:hypothetical protein [Maliponia aquimaris]SMX40222.1 hypothetical protein MAA8898_02078 [Maliponia aquimaris]
MAIEDNITDELLKKLAGKALGIAGSKLAAGLGGMVLDIFGLGGDAMSDIDARLTRLSKQVQQIDARLSKLIDLQKWNQATRDFGAVLTALKTDTSNLSSYLSSGKSKADIQADITSYVTDPANNFAQYDKDLTTLDDAIMGSQGTIIGPTADPLFKIYVDTHWDTLHDPDPAKVATTLEAAYTRMIHVQQAITSLLVAYRIARNDQILAQAARQHFAERAVAQYQTLWTSMPKLVAVQSLPCPGLSIAFDTLKIRDSKTWTPIYRVGDRFDLFAYQKDENWQLVRCGTRNGEPVYQLNNFYFYAAQEKTVSVPTNSYSIGIGPTQREVPSDYVDAPLLGAIMSASAPYRFALRCGAKADHYILEDDKGQVIGFEDYGYSGRMMQMTKPPTAPWTLTMENADLKPGGVQPVLSAWTGAFSKHPQGEGRFTPGFRVRYCVIPVNRFGEGPKSPWMKLGTDNSTQIAGGYTSNPDYYFPQIKVGTGANRAEGYRLFRQFWGGKLEEIAFKLVGDIAAGDEIILDDTTP